MSKYDKMIALNKKTSEAKVMLAKQTIFQMTDDGEKITIPKLMAKTGLSRGFFYKNPEVRREVDRAIDRQAGVADPRRNILDMAMDSELTLLRQQVEALKAENANLKQENQKLQKALEKKNLSLIKKL